MNKHQSATQRQPGRFDRHIVPHDADPYGVRTRQSEPLTCLICEATFNRGQWSWIPLRRGGRAVMCAACRRTRENQPAGYLFLEGEFFAEHRADIRRLLLNREAAEKAAHPMRRIMAMQDTERGMQVHTTDLTLARDLGAAVQKSFQGELLEVKAPGAFEVRVFWYR